MCQETIVNLLRMCSRCKWLLAYNNENEVLCLKIGYVDTKYISRCRFYQEGEKPKPRWFR